MTDVSGPMVCKHCGQEITPVHKPIFGTIYQDTKGEGACPPDPSQGIFANLRPFHEPKEK